MSLKILCVDDESNVLQALARQHGRRFDIHTALGCQPGVMALMDEGPFAVVISDLRMPGLDGIRFLSLVKRVSPDTVRIMLTGQGDLQSEAEAVNEGKVFQFLTKPCPPEKLALAIESALEQYRLVVAERELLEKTLHGMVGVLSEILSLVSPAAFSRAHRIRRYVNGMSAALKLPDRWRYELAAMLSQIGYVSLPTETLIRLHAGQALSKEERGVAEDQAQLGHDLLARIPRLEKVAEMVLQQGSSWSGDRGIDDPVKIGAQLLKMALDFDQQLTAGRDAGDVIEDMGQRADYHPALKAALQEIRIVESRGEPRDVCISDLEPRMVTSAPVYGMDGVLLLGKGEEIAEAAIARLKGFAATIGVVEPIKVLVPGAITTTGVGFA